MATFAVFAGDLLVGHSQLEFGDAPMGVAFGVFVPVEAYAQIRDECRTNHADQTALGLTVKTEAGVTVSCAGVSVLEEPPGAEEPCIELNVLGVPYPLYGELFPHHVASYERQFS